MTCIIDSIIVVMSPCQYLDCTQYMRDFASSSVSSSLTLVSGKIKKNNLFPLSYIVALSYCGRSHLAYRNILTNILRLHSLPPPLSLLFAVCSSQHKLPITSTNYTKSNTTTTINTHSTFSAWLFNTQTKSENWGNYLTGRDGRSDVPRRSWE